MEDINENCPTSKGALRATYPEAEIGQRAQIR